MSFAEDFMNLTELSPMETLETLEPEVFNAFHINGVIHVDLKGLVFFSDFSVLALTEQFEVIEPSSVMKLLSMLHPFENLPNVTVSQRRLSEAEFKALQ